MFVIGDGQWVGVEGDAYRVLFGGLGRAKGAIWGYVPGIRTPSTR